MEDLTFKEGKGYSPSNYTQPTDAVDMTHVFRQIFKRALIILLLSASIGIFAFLFSERTYVPQYSTTTTFVVTARGNSTTVFSNLTTASGLADVFSTLLNTQTMGRVIEETTGVSFGDGYVHASLIPETNLINMTVTAQSPKTAFLAAQSIIDNHSTVTDKILSNAVLDVLLSPTMPVVPNNPNQAQTTGVWAFIASVLLLCIAFGTASYWRDDIKSEGDAAKKLDCKLIATIYHEKKYKTLSSKLRHKKTSILVTNPTTSYRFVETFKMLRTRLEYRMKDRGAKILTIASLAENEGKSTVAANIALILAHRGNRVLLVDADLLKPAQWRVFSMRAKSGTTLPEVVLSKLPLSLAQQCPFEKNLYMLFSEKGNRSSNEIVASNAFKNFLNRVREEFDYCILDTPPMSVSSEAEILAEYSDAALLVVQQGVARASDINDVIDLLNEDGKKLLGLIFNNVHASPFSDEGGYGYGEYGRSYERNNGFSGGRSSDVTGDGNMGNMGNMESMGNMENTGSMERGY